MLNYAANEEQTGGLSPFWVAFSVLAEDENTAGERGLMLSPSQVPWMVTSLSEEWRGCDRCSPFGCCWCSHPANRRQLLADLVCTTVGWGSSTSHRSLLAASVQLLLSIACGQTSESMGNGAAVLGDGSCHVHALVSAALCIARAWVWFWDVF